MKLLNWMQSKLNGRQGIKKANPISAYRRENVLQEPRKDEFSDWPNGLLAIGTFGNNNLKEDDPERHNFQGNTSSSQDDYLQDLTPEEVVKLQKELKLLLQKQIGSGSTAESETPNLPLDKFLNCPSTLEIDRGNSDAYTDDSNNKDGHLQHSTSVVVNRGKDVCLDNTKGAIGKRSLSFLLKKMFVCRSGFAPAPSLRDPLPESRMEKILRAILHKKIYPQTSSPTLSKRKLLENRHLAKPDNEDEMNEKVKDGSKWVKTDSEYIVLEI